MLMVRGVRGAITATENTAEAIVTATRELLLEMIQANGIEQDHVASVIFTTTPDLNAAYPAQAARAVGWRHTAVLGCTEMNMPEGLPRCIRILIHWNTMRRLDEIVHVYMNGASQLRPDLNRPDRVIVNNSKGRTEL
jgi:chorismate mutase